MDFSDKKLMCKDCGKEFIWSQGEQKFFADKGFINPPIRCSDCRKKKKSGGAPNNDRTNQAPRELFQIKCSSCSKESEIPFKPQNPDNILCSECFEKSLTQK